MRVRRNWAGKCSLCFLVACLMGRQLFFNWNYGMSLYLADTSYHISEDAASINGTAETSLLHQELAGGRKETYIKTNHSTSENERHYRFDNEGLSRFQNAKIEAEGSPLMEKANRTESLVFHFIYNGGWSHFQPFMMRAVESVFFHHPNAEVKLHTQQREENVSIPLLEPLLEKFDLEIVHYSLAEELELLKKYMNATLVQGFIDGLPDWIDTSRFREYNKANIYRLLLMYTRGGIYLDLDFIILRPMNNIGDNVVGKQREDSINNAVLKFKKGHNYIEKALYNLLTGFMPFSWGYQGPKLLTRTMRKDFRSCRWLEPGREGVVASTVCPVHVKGVDVFYPWNWKATDKICYGMSSNDTIAQDWKNILESTTVAVHLTGKKKYLPTKPDTLCRFLKNKFCITKKTCKIIV